MKNRVSLMILALAMMLMGFAQVAKAVVPAGEYYIYNDFFRKLLTNDGDNPRLATYASASDANYIFVAEASGTTGYVKLKQKSTGKYLTASTSNTYSVLFSANGTGDQYLWALDQQFSTKIVNKKNTGKRLGCDFNSGSTYFWVGDVKVPVYYDKGTSALNWFSIIPSNGKGFESSRLATKTEQFTNEYGVEEKDAYQVSSAVEVDGIDYHIIGSTPFTSSGSVNLKNDHSWLVFENNRPSNVKSSWLKYVKINGVAAKVGTNCRVEIYLKGAVVIPTPAEGPFIGVTAKGTFSKGVGLTEDLGTYSNEITSFTLKRGYMVAVSTGTKMSGDNRIYVADHADLTVDVSKINSLKGRISSIRVRNWHYTSKSGYCSTTGDIMDRTKQIGGSWCWNWDANKSSSDDVEYIPIKQHRYWPGDGSFDNDSYTAAMLINEPEHSEQHTSDQCSCEGPVNQWNAYVATSALTKYGLRLGSPSATDLNWFSDYYTNCKNMKQRCDFTCTHGYWTTEWTENLNWLQSFGRPIWITEWKYGASWTSGSSPSSEGDYAGKILNILDKLEYNNYVERYSYYDADTGYSNGWMTSCFWDSNPQKGNNPTGDVISRVKPHLGYRASIQPVPNWWTPDFEDVKVTGTSIQDGKYSLAISNPNKDATGTLEVLKLSNTGTWETVYTLTDRSLLESSTLNIEGITGVTEDDLIKVRVGFLYSNDTKETASYTKIENLINTRFDEGSNVTADIPIGGANNMKAVSGWTAKKQASDEYLSGGQIAWGSGKKLMTYSLPAKNSEGTTAGGALALVAAWGNTTVYEQGVVLEPGKYTITVPVYSANGTQAMAKNLIGFITENGEEYLAKTTKYNVGEWTTEVISFNLLETTMGRLSVGYQSANNVGSGTQAKLFVDYIDIQREDIVQDFSTAGNTDNLTFNFGTFTDKSVLTYAKDIKNASTEVSQMQAVDNWNIVTNGDAHAAAQMKWGTSLTFAGQAVPAKNSDGTTYGGGLGICAVWSAKTQYTQPLTLPMGKYTITIPYYNVSGSKAVNGNYFGFRSKDGNKVDGANTFCYSSVKTFATGKWETMSITFTLTQDTEGELSLGYEATNSGAADMPHLFIDYVKITCDDREWPTMGDANFDGTVTLSDVPAAITGIQDADAKHKEVLDVNRDSSLDKYDVTETVSILLNK